MKKKNLNALAMSMIGVAMILPSCKGDRQQQQQAEVPELSVITVGEESARLESGIPCTLQGENDVEIRPQIQGFLTRVNVEEGQHVSKGQTLFVIDQVQLQAAVDAAKAQVEVAKASVNTAQTNANNNKILLDKNIISAPAFAFGENDVCKAVCSVATVALNAAKAQYNAALANLTSARKNLSYTNVTAPISGVIGSIDFKEGSLVSPQTLLTVVSNNADMQANFSFNEKDILAMTDNGRCSIDEAIRQLPPVTLLMANGERYGIPGKVTAVSGVIDSNTGSASAKAIFRNPDGMLHSGNTGQILMPSVRQNAMLVPQSATYEVQDMKFVYVVGDSNKVHSRAIQITEDNDGKNYIVTGGLKPGETIVVEGVGITVKDNMQIKPKK